MEILKDVVLVLHFIGLASLLGGFLVQMSARTKRIEMAMVHGALTQLVTGLILVGLDQAIGGDAAPNNTKIAVKLVILLVITVLVLRGRRARSVSTGVWGAVGGLTLLNVAIAVLWH